MEDDEEERGPELSWRGLSWGEALNQAKKTGRSPVFHNVPVLLNDWAHVARKGQTGLFGKKMKNREETRREERKTTPIGEEDTRRETRRRLRPARQRLAVKHNDDSDLRGRDSP